jgi:hypothetical protein
MIPRKHLRAKPSALFRKMAFILALRSGVRRFYSPGYKASGNDPANFRGYAVGEQLRSPPSKKSRAVTFPCSSSLSPHITPDNKLTRHDIPRYTPCFMTAPAARTRFQRSILAKFVTFQDDGEREILCRERVKYTYGKRGIRVQKA